MTCAVSSTLRSPQKYFVALRKSNFLISESWELFDSCSNVFIQSPLRCNPVIGVVFVHCCNFIVFCLDKRSYMERRASVFGIDTNNCNNQIIYNFYSLNGSIPFSGILTICGNIFIHRKMLVAAMPIYIGVRMKVFSNFPFVLGKNGFPKLFYIHAASIMKDGVEQLGSGRGAEDGFLRALG